jgi:hypothetical protein
LIVSRIMFAALIAILSGLIALALTTGVTLGRAWRVIRHSEDPDGFWLIVIVLVTALVVALWTVIRLIRARLL